MVLDHKQGAEPDLYATESASGSIRRITNLRDIAEVPSIWSKIHLLSEKLGAETIGCQQLPEEARDPNQKPWSLFPFLFIISLGMSRIYDHVANRSRYVPRLEHSQLSLFSIHNWSPRPLTLRTWMVGLLRNDHLLQFPR